MPHGPGDVLSLIRHGRANTRGDVLEITGLSRVTIAQRLDALLAAGMIAEGDTTEATGGRRRRSLVFNTSQSRALVAAVDTTHARIAVTDLGGAVLAQDEIDAPVEEGPSQVLDQISAAMAALLERSGLRPSDLGGAGVSLPGPIDHVSGRPSQPPILPGWDGYPVADHLQAGLPGVPVLTANDADAAALGEYAVGYAHATSMCLVKVSTGIGTGIVINGRSYTGADGGAGDIGHVRVSSRSDALCQCGGHGCLAALASGRAVAGELTALGVPATSGREVRQLLRAGNADAARLTQQAGRRIGEVMATVVCVLNPEVVLIGGDLASAPLLAGIRETLYRLSLPRATRHMTLQLGSLGEDAAVVGLTRLVVDREFSAEAVNLKLRG
ncbi:MAG: ROK family protein [Nocardioidaceae bacterium]